MKHNLLFALMEVLAQMILLFVAMELLVVSLPTITVVMTVSFTIIYLKYYYYYWLYLLNKQRERVHQ